MPAITPATLALGIWTLGAMVIPGTMLGAHLLTLPTPELSTVAAQFEPGSWQALHALSSECACSKAVLHTLLRSARPDVDETVLWIGPPSDLRARLAARGIGFVSVDQTTLDAAWGIPAVPVMVVANPQAEVVYSGGYTERKQAGEVADRRILDTLLAGQTHDSLPLFGCPINAALRADVDPLGLR